MSSRDYYKAAYNSKDASKMSSVDSQDILDNDTEFNANQFKLYDDFTTDLRINFNLINNYHTVRTDNRGFLRNDISCLRNYEVLNKKRSDPNDSGVDVENGNLTEDSVSKDSDLLENEVMVDPWSSMDSSNSPLTDSGPSASEDCTPSTSSENRGPLDASSPLSPDARRLPDPKLKTKVPSKPDKARSRDLTLELDNLETEHLPRRPHFLDDDFPPSKSNIECRIPKPHFLDHSPSPDEFDERSDITNPNFLDDDVDGEDQAQKKAGALPKRQIKPPSSVQEERPHRTTFRSALHYGLESAARSSERDKRASQLYRGTWPGEREWSGHDASSVRSFSSNGSAEGHRPSSNLENKMECVCSLISLLSLSPENNADLSGPLLEMSRSVESCVAMRQAGCIPLLVQLIHSKVSRETRDRAAKALRNIIHTQTDDKAGRREARVWRLLEQVREYCYALEDIVEARKEGKEAVEDDNTKHPSQSVAALMKLSFDEEHRHVVCQLGGLPALAALVSGDQAAHGARADDHTCLTMRKYAGMTLTNLTFGDGNNKSLLCSFKDFMLALVEQLESPNDDMRQVTAAVLRNLSWRADTNSKQVLREVGAVKGLTKAAMTCQKEATLKSVLSALWNLTAHCSMNKVALCSVEGALGFLVDMLSYDSPTKTLAIIENAGGIMRNVSSHIAVREDYRQILRERNCLSVLLQHLKSPSLTVVSNSCGTLWNLSARCPQDQQFLWDHGAVPMLRSLIHSKHKMIAMGSSAALKNLLNSKPGKTHILTLDTTARSMNLPALPTLGARKQKALEQELDQNLAETCDNIEPATSPTTSNREEKNLYTATERQLALNLERHRMTSSSPLMGTLTSQISLSHSAHLASYLSCSNTLLKGALATRSVSSGSANDVHRSDSKDSVTSTHSDTVFEKVMRTGKMPVPTPRNKDLVKADPVNEAFKAASKSTKDSFLRYPTQPPIPPPRSSTDMRTNYTESGYDVDQDSCDQPVDYSRKYSETKTAEPDASSEKVKTEGKKYSKKETPSTFGDYQETDLDQPTDYSLRYAEHQSETGSDTSEPPGPSVNEDTIKHFATEGTPYETPIIFSTATSMSDLRVIGKDSKAKAAAVKENPEIMTHSDEKDTCSIEDPPRPDNDRAISTPQNAASEPVPEKRGVFDTKFSSGMISPEKPVNYCDEGTPGYFSRVSSLSSLGEPTEEDSLAKKNAMATISVEPGVQEQSATSAKDKEGSKAVTFAVEEPPRFVEDTPLMFSRSSSLGSLPDCDTPHHDDHASIVSELSRATSGWLSPSELPESAGHSVPASPPVSPPRSPLKDPGADPATPPIEPPGAASVFAERVERFALEHTPAHFSTATSLSSLTIDAPPKQSVEENAKQSPEQSKPSASIGHGRAYKPQVPPLPRNSAVDTPKGVQSPGDSCRVYYTEDTPAILSKAGSHSNLSVLSIDSAPADTADGDALPARPDVATEDNPDSSDSSNLSDAGDLLEECIQKGIAKVVKNKGPSDVAVYTDEYYRAAPYPQPRAAEGAPPLPPRGPPAAPPRPPPRVAALDHGNAQGEDESRVAGSGRHAAATLPRADSLSSLSLDSFGSTDREIFEETVQAGLSSVTPKLSTKGKAHSVERPAELARTSRHPRSLDRNDRSTHSRGRIRDRDSERVTKRVSRPQRSDSLSSLSNESFGSTDKEVFERCVQQGMARARRSRPARPEAGPGPAGAASGPPGAPGPSAAKNAPAPPAARAPAGAAPPKRATTGCDEPAAGGRNRTPSEVPELLLESPDTTFESARSRGTSPGPLDRSNELPTVGSADTTADSAVDATRSGSNECLAPKSANTTLDSEIRDELNRSNESYAEILDGSWSDGDAPHVYDGTLTRKGRNTLEWNDIKCEKPIEDISKRSTDTWNDNTCPDDVTFPTMSVSVHTVSPLRSEAGEGGGALPDLLETGDPLTMTSSRPDLTDKLHTEPSLNFPPTESDTDGMLENVAEPSLVALVDDEGQRLDSLMALAIEKEAARLAAQLKSSRYSMETSGTSLASLDLDSVKPPSDLGSLLSLSVSGLWEDSSNQTSKKSQKSRKKSLPVASMVKRALSNSMHRGSSEHLDGSPASLLDNVKPPSEMENVDLESSMVSLSSIVSEVAEGRERTPVVFDLKQPIQEFPHCNAFGTVFHDLDKVNPPSLFDEMAESTLEIDQTTAHRVFDDCASTLHVVTDIPSGSENCTPLPSDMSSVESTPKKQRSNYLTPKERRYISKDRYQTYTITDSVSDNDAVLRVETEQYATWTRSESDNTDDCVAAPTESKSKRRVSAKQRRQEDRARYQTQTVDIQNILTQETSSRTMDPQIESLKRRLAAKKTIKQKRVEDAERFRTRTLSEDIPPSPTFVTRDANFENVETTTGYDSLSSNEPGHQQLPDERADDDALSRGADSGHHEDDFELNSTQMQTYTRSFRNYLPVVESPAAVDLCVVNNLKNIEMTASYRRRASALPAGGACAGEGDARPEDKPRSESDADVPQNRPKPKIIKPDNGRDLSLDSNESCEKEEAPKAIRGRKKAIYVSPYRRNIPTRKPAPTPAKCTPKPPAATKLPTNLAKAQTSAKFPSKSSTSRTPSANTSPKKSLNKSPTKIAQQKAVAIPIAAAKPLPLERQGTFTKEESTVPPKDLPVPDGKRAGPAGKAGAPGVPVATSPSRLPQPSRYSRTTFAKSNSSPKQSKPPGAKRPPEPAMRSSASNHSLHSTDSARTVTLTRGSRQGSTSSVNSQSSKTNTRDVESRIASLWKKVEHSKSKPKQPDRRVWIESDREPPKLIRSSTFEGQPKQSQMCSAPKQKSAIGIRVSQIPSLRPKSTPCKAPGASPTRKPLGSRVFSRKPINGHIAS